MINFMLGDLSERLNDIRKKLSTKGSHWPENWQFPRFFREARQQLTAWTHSLYVAVASVITLENRNLTCKIRARP